MRSGESKSLTGDDGVRVDSPGDERPGSERGERREGDKQDGDESESSRVAAAELSSLCSTRLGSEKSEEMRLIFAFAVDLNHILGQNIFFNGKELMEFGIYLQIESKRQDR